MALTDSDLSELLDSLRAGEMTDTIRTSLGWTTDQREGSRGPSCIAGRPPVYWIGGLTVGLGSMFWLSRNRLSGS